MTKNSEESTPQKAKSSYRVLVAILIGVIVAGYTLGVILGLLPTDRKIDTVTLLLIVLAVVVIVGLVSPETLKRVKILELGTGGVKFELEQVKQKQAQQEDRLKQFAEILPLLLPEPEQQHLLNLTNGQTTDYVGNHILQADLRHLRSIQLIKMIGNHHVSEMTDNKKFNLADYVEVTPEGKRWIHIIQEIKQEAIDDMEAKKQ